MNTQNKEREQVKPDIPYDKIVKDIQLTEAATGLKVSFVQLHPEMMAGGVGSLVLQDGRNVKAYRGYIFPLGVEYSLCFDRQEEPVHKGTIYLYNKSLNYTSDYHYLYGPPSQPLDIEVLVNGKSERKFRIE